MTATAMEYILETVHNWIQSFLTQSLIDIVFAVLTLVIYTFIMATYHIGILGIFFIGSLLYI